MPSDPASSVEAFRTQGYAVIHALIPADRVARLREHLAGRAKAGTMLAGDAQVPDTPTVYGDAEIDALMQDIKPVIEAHTGLKLHPTYSYGRIYKKGDTLPPHRDREACQISISLNLGQEPEDPWTLYIGDQNAPFAARLGPGDAFLYKGVELTHWREAYPGDRLFQVFLHYVDANGPYAGEKFDQRAALGNAFKPEITGRLLNLMITNLTD